MVTGFPGMAEPYGMPGVWEDRWGGDAQTENALPVIPVGTEDSYHIALTLYSGSVPFGVTFLLSFRQVNR